MRVTVDGQVETRTASCSAAGNQCTPAKGQKTELAWFIEVPECPATTTTMKTTTPPTTAYPTTTTLKTTITPATVYSTTTETTTPDVTSGMSLVILLNMPNFRYDSVLSHHTCNGK